MSTQSVYCGDTDRSLTAVEKAKVERIRQQTMSLRTAKDIESSLDPNRAFDTRGQYMDCLAALTKLYPEEVKRTHTSGRKLRDLLASSCDPDHLEYMLNEARFVRKLSVQDRETFQTGVLGNEAFHLETKHVFMGQSMHAAVLDMKVEHLQIRKLLAHNVCMYNPTVNPMDELEIVQAKVASMDPWCMEGSWKRWCDACDFQRGGNKPVKIQERDAQRQRFRVWGSKQMSPMKNMKQRKHPKKKVSVFARAKNHVKLVRS